MKDIIVADFNIKGIKEYIISLFEKYDNINKKKYGNLIKDSQYFVDEIMKYILKSINISIKEFNDMLDFGFDDIDNGNYVIDNISKIVTLYIYKKFLINNNIDYKNEMIILFNNVKEQMYNNTKKLSIQNLCPTLDIEIYKDTLILSKFIYNIENIKNWENDINLDKKYSSSEINNILLNDLYSLYNYVYQIFEEIYNKQFYGIAEFFYREYNDNSIIEENNKEFLANLILDNNINIEKLNLNDKNNDLSLDAINEEKKVDENTSKLNDDNNINKLCSKCNKINKNCICSIDSNSSSKNESEKIEKKRKTKKETNQEDEINIVLDKIKKHYKKIYNDEDIYNQLIIENRQVIKTFSIIHQKYIENKINDKFIDEIFKLYDTNKARFIKNTEIFYKIYNEKELYNSNYLFLKFTFNNVNKESIVHLINTLKTNLLNY